MLRLLRCEKHICPHFSLKALSRKQFSYENNLQKRESAFDHPESHRAENHLKIYHLFINVICFICTEFRKNCMIIYRIINVLLKNANFLHKFFSFNGKSFDSNCMTHLERVTEYIEIIILKFKRNMISIQCGYFIFFQFRMRQ